MDNEGSDSLGERKISDAGVCMRLKDAEILISHSPIRKCITHLIRLVLDRDDVVPKRIFTLDFRRGGEESELFFVHLVEPLSIVKSMREC